MNALEEPSMKRWRKPGGVSKIVARGASSSFSFATRNTPVVGALSCYNDISWGITKCYLTQVKMMKNN
jgi:hypothetical protein